MSGAFRTASGGTVMERGAPLRFTFDGHTYTGLAGDTLASALLAHGVHLAGRSSRYHRPRGFLSAGGDEPNAWVTVRRDAARSTPNLRATQVELHEGLTAFSQNRWPSLSLDLGSLADRLAPLMPSGFPQQTVPGPQQGWRWLPWLRAVTGLGSAPAQPDPDRYTQRHAHCEVLVIGAGPAGLAAAQAAALTGVRVILCDEQPVPGGSLLGRRGADIAGEPAQVWRAHVLEKLAGCPRVTLLSRTSAFGCLPDDSVGLLERLTDHLARPDPDSPRERLWQVRTKTVVLATGAFEQPLVFPGNDRPGILLAGAAQTYLHRHGVLCGRRAVLVTACDEGYQAALDLHDAGVRIPLIADVRDQAAGPAAEAARTAGLAIQTRMRVLGTHGRMRVRSLTMARLGAGGRLEQIHDIACDHVLMSGGYTAGIPLFPQAHDERRREETRGAGMPGRAQLRVRTAGACRRLRTLAQAVEDGRAAGAAAAREAQGRLVQVPAGDTAAPRIAGAADLAPADALSVACPPGARQPAFVDWQADVTAADLTAAEPGDFRTADPLKSHAAYGMGGETGRSGLGGMPAMALVEPALYEPGLMEPGLMPPGVGIPGGLRLPYTPVSFGSFAGLSRGDLLVPARRSPLHGWAVRQGAVFENAGGWKRARCFPRPGEDIEAAIERECLAVRRGCGLFDASPQGRIEVDGPDALEFLERLYINSLSDLGVGGCRYALLLREDGSIQDDGIIARVAPDRFHVTTTAGSDARVVEIMEEYRQGVWRDLAVWVTSTTDAWAVIAVQGPLSRNVLKDLLEDIDLSGAALPHMGVTCGRIGEVPVLVLRVSFTGELGFEVRVPADYGEAVWEAILEAGERHGGVTPYGTGAMSVLRAEKGYMLLGQDTDSLTIPDDVGLGWPIGDGKPDFVGKRSLDLPAMSAPDRPQLVGLLPLDPRILLEEGAQVLPSRRSRPPTRPLGHVTSACHSPTLGRGIALALLSGGRSRMGQILHVPDPRGGAVVQVTAPVFYDPEGWRLHV